MKKIILGLLMFGLSVFANTASDTLVLKFSDAVIQSKYECEPKKSPWYKFNTSKDNELEKYCGEKTNGFIKSIDQGVFFNEETYARKGEIAINLAFKDSTFSAEKILNDLERNGIVGVRRPTVPLLLKLVDRFATAKYSFIIRNPDGLDVKVLKKGVVDTNNYIIKVPQNFTLKTYSNTYDIDEIKECIDGKVWIKKYGKQSGDKCKWIEIKK